MLRIHSLIIGLLVLQTAALPEPAQLRSATAHHTLSDLDDALSKAVREKRVPGITAAALNRDGSVIYNNSFGTININDPFSAPVTASTKMQIYSMTKAVVSVAALQLVEQQKLDLDDLVEDYIPSWKNISVLVGFTADGQPILRRPKTKAKIINLFTHSAGPEYNFLNENISRWEAWAATQTPPPLPPLAVDPRTGWHYGTSIDTLGNIVESLSGLRLDAYIDRHIFQPLGAKNSGLIAADVYLHQRQPNGTITSAPRNKPFDVPFGGYYLTSTLNDYASFLLPLINEGSHPVSGVRILQPSTVRKYLFIDLLPQSLIRGHPPIQGVGVFNSSNPAQSNSGEILPGVPKGWSAAFLTNNKDVVGRRRKYSGTWAGILNTYFWVDNKGGKLGVILTSLGPFLDPEVLGLFDKLEEVAYAS